MNLIAYYINTHWSIKTKEKHIEHLTSQCSPTSIFLDHIDFNLFVFVFVSLLSPSKYWVLKKTMPDLDDEDDCKTCWTMLSKVKPCKWILTFTTTIIIMIIREASFFIRFMGPWIVKYWYVLLFVSCIVSKLEDHLKLAIMKHTRDRSVPQEMKEDGKEKRKTRRCWWLVGHAVKA